MARTNKKLVTAVEAYFADLGRVRASGGATGERSYYPALAGLLGAVGATLKPKVFCVQERRTRGPVIPTSPCTRRDRYRGAIRGRGSFPSVASSRSRALATLPGQPRYPSR